MDMWFESGKVLNSSGDFRGLCAGQWFIQGLVSWRVGIRYQVVVSITHNNTLITLGSTIDAKACPTLEFFYLQVIKGPLSPTQ